MLTKRFDDAIVWATRRHAQQRRHNTGTAFISHPLATCAIVLEEGGDECQAIAALLHDVLEDTSTTRDELRERFGEAVYRIVDDCTDADRSERARTRWQDRKESHLQRMATVPEDSLLIIAADKICSLQSLVDDLDRYGPALFDRSARSADELLAHYREVCAIVAPRLRGRPVVRRLRLLIEQFEAWTGSHGRPTLE
jgi:(p)ppGpp synthase/HD superfamily hydrolase